MKKNGVVVVTYNRLNLLKECIEAILNQSYPFDELILVNNASTDGTNEYLSSVHGNGKTKISVINSKENLGGAGGFYCAMKEAQKRNFDYLLIIDDDAIIRFDYMQKLMEYIDNNPKKDIEALAGAVMLNNEIDISHRRRIGNKIIFTEPFVPINEYSNSFECDTATFCGLVIRGDAFKRIGLPMKDYFIWYDDTEYSLRLNGVVVVPDAKLDHKTKPAPPNAGLLERTTWRHYYGYRNRLDTSKKHFGKFAANVVALEYHVLRFMSTIMLINPKTREIGKFNRKMIKDALKDGKSGNLGKNPKYHP